MRTSIVQLQDALAKLDAAVACCLAVAELPRDTAPEARTAAADVAVRDYEAADAVAEALLSVIIAAGGCPGLAQAVEAACDRASARVEQAWGQSGKTQAVARHAYEQAAERALRVTVALALPYWRGRLSEDVVAEAEALVERWKGERDAA